METFPRLRLAGVAAVLALLAAVAAGCFGGGGGKAGGKSTAHVTVLKMANVNGEIDPPLQLFA